MGLQPDSHLQVGMKAPDFTLPGVPLGDFQLSQAVKVSPVVLYFYVFDFGQLCNIVMLDMIKHRPSFDDLGVQFVGISVDEVRMHVAFKTKFKIPYTLLSDDEGEVAKAYGVLMETGLYLNMATRALFLIDDEMTIRYRWVALDPAWEPDMEEVLDAIRDMDR